MVNLVWDKTSHTKSQTLALIKDSQMDNLQSYETLDPENWDEMRALAHRMVDDAISYLETVRERPVWQPVPDEVAAHFKEPAPHQPERAESVYEEFLENILPYPMGTIHPRFWSWYM